MRLWPALFLALLPLAAPAQVAPPLSPPVVLAAPVGDLIAALQLDEVIKAMRLEGIAYGETLETDLFPDRGGRDWRAAVEAIYAPEAMRARLVPVMERELSRLPPGQVDAARDFFRSALGQRIVSLENSARLAQLDDDVKEASAQEAERLQAEAPARFALLRRFIAANDLVETNVVGSLNANAAFYFGLNAAGAFPEPMSDEEVLSDVAAQEDGIRAETAGWMDSYLALAYQPLSDAELTSYIQFSESSAGRGVNRAMFAAFDAMFAGISRDLGRTAARYIAGEEL